MHLWYCLEHLHLQKGRKRAGVTEGREGGGGKENVNCLLDETTRIQLPTGGFEKKKNEHTNEEQLLFSDWLQTRISRWFGLSA